MLLDSPPFFIQSFILSILFFSGVGLIFSIPTLWKYIFSNPTIYLKSGEYGESRFNHSSWSLWKEPINGWSSLIYSVFGGVISLCALNDMHSPTNANIVSSHPEFSLLFGVSSILLGVSSCLFHASHSEFWRSMDAGMTSGVCVPILALAFYDRSRVIGIDNGLLMTLIAIVFQISLTYGFLPYGSSDILLPTLIISCFILELSPPFGGPVDKDQFILWYRIIYITICGALLRASDILYVKHKTSEYGYVMKIYLALTLLFIYLLGAQDLAILTGILCGAIVWRTPYLGHMFWHFFSSFALFYWWYMYRIRPGDPPMPSLTQDLTFSFSPLSLIFFILLKNAVRRIFMSIAITKKLKDRIMYFSEHSFFAYWGYYVIHLLPNEDSWLQTPSLCWNTVIHSSEFHSFYLAKVATHLEDLLYAFTLSYFTSKEKTESRESSPIATTSDDDIENTTNNSNHSNNLLNISNNDKKEEINNSNPHSDVLMNIHHIATALLCTLSYTSGYLRIGSVIMFLHDISDIPLDLLRISMAINKQNLIIFSFAATLLTWLYWRLWYFPFFVIYSVTFESKSLDVTSTCFQKVCTWSSNWPERLPFVVLLLSLLVLHYIWFYQMLLKGKRELLDSTSSSTSKR